MKSSKITIGKKFGLGTIIGQLPSKKDGRYWLLKCKCGTEYSASTRNLNTKDTKSCGCLKSPSLIGEKFGCGIVVRASDKKYRNWKCWILKCSCGNEYECQTSKLKNGRVKSCGCYRLSKIRTGTKIIPGWFFGRIKNSLNRGRKVDFDLSINYLEQLLTQQSFKCAITGLEISIEPVMKRRHETTASLDRIDSSKGYIRGNVQFVHKDINMMKWSLTENRFYELCKLALDRKTNAVCQTTT